MVFEISKKLSTLAKEYLLSVPVANLENRGPGLDRSRDVLRGCRSGCDTHRGRSYRVLALVADHGVGARLHGGRGKGTTGGCIGPVLCVAIVPVFLSGHVFNGNQLTYQ